MKNSFNFIQIANWVYLIRTNLKKFRLRLDTENVSRDEAVKLLKLQKYHLELIKDIFNKRSTLSGIQTDFLKNLTEIKKSYGIEE